MVPKHFHFVIPLIVDRGIFKREYISQGDSLQLWHPVTVPCSVSVVLQMLVKAVCMARCLILYTRGNGTENT